MSSSTPPPYGDENAYSPRYGLDQPPTQGGHVAPQGQWSGQAPTPTRAPDSKGFFSALFDFSFNSFVTLVFAKWIYVLALVSIGLFWVFAVLAGFSVGIGQGLAALLFVSIFALFSVVLVRVGLEFSVAMVRTAQNTSALVRR